MDPQLDNLANYSLIPLSEADMACPITDFVLVDGSWDY